MARSNIVKMKSEGLKEVPETCLAQPRDEDKAVQFKDIKPYSWEEFNSEYVESNDDRSDDDESDDDESDPSKIVFYTSNSTEVHNALHENRIPMERYLGDNPDTPMLLATHSKSGKHSHIRRVPDNSVQLNVFTNACIKDTDLYLPCCGEYGAVLGLRAMEQLLLNKRKHVSPHKKDELYEALQGQCIACGGKSPKENMDGEHTLQLSEKRVPRSLTPECADHVTKRTH